MLEIFVRGNVPSLKNGKIVTSNRAIVSNPLIRRWQKESKQDWIDNKEIFKQAIKGLPLPLFIHLTFIRNRDNTWDYTAPTETIFDEMVKQGWVWDDNIYEVVPCFGKPKIDKKSPGVIIRVLQNSPIYSYI